MSHTPDKTAEASTITAYTMVGGEAGLRRIVARFYDVMDSDPEAAGIPVRASTLQRLLGFLGLGGGGA